MAATNNLATSEILGTLERTVDQASSSVHATIDKASGVARPAVDQLTAGAHKAVKTLAGAATRAAETLDVRGRQLMDAQSRLAGNCSARIREKPIMSLGIAIAAGVLLGWILKKR